MRPAIRQIVAIHARDHHVAELHLRRHFSDMARLFGIERELLLGGGAFGHGTKAATAGAQVSEDHERRRAAMKAFVHVRAARRLADRVQAARAQLRFQGLDGSKMGFSLAQPRRQSGTGRVDLD